MFLSIFNGVSTIEMVLCVLFWILSMVGLVIIFKDVIIQLIIMHKHSDRNKN